MKELEEIQNRTKIGFLEVAAANMSGNNQMALDVAMHNREYEDRAKDFAAAMAGFPDAYKGSIMEIANSTEDFEDFMDTLMGMVEDTEDGFGGLGGAVEEGFIGPIEAAKEAAFEFSNAREEMFFGMAKGNITGDMVKQVVNKGVETLINTTEVIMTNNFNGMTTGQAANEITKQVIQQLNSRGLNIAQ